MPDEDSREKGQDSHGKTHDHEHGDSEVTLAPQIGNDTSDTADNI